MRLPDDYEDHGGGLTPTVIINRIIQLHRRRMYNRQEIIRQTNIRTRRT